MPLYYLISIGAVAFAASGVLNVFADFMPLSATRLMNFAGVALGIFGLQALYLFTRLTTGLASLIGFLLTSLGFIGIAGFLFADAFVFPLLDPIQVEALTASSTGLAIFGSVILYVVGTLTFATALFRAGAMPKPALLLWAVGTAPTTAAIALPLWVMTVAEIAASVGIIWMAVTILRGARRRGETAAV